MSKFCNRLAVGFVASACAGMLLAAVGRSAAPPEPSAVRQTARKLLEDGNFREALDKLRELTLNSKTGAPRDVADDFRYALSAYQRLNQVDRIDAYREEVAKQHAKQWQVLAAVAQSYQDIEHVGFMIAGEFRRGSHRGGGAVANATSRDRVRAMQLFWQALELLKQDDAAKKTADAAAMLNQFAAVTMTSGSYQSWRLQTLTDLDALPDVDEGWAQPYDAARGAPVDEQGDPVLYDEPDDWRDAKNDGQRWRWLLAERSRWQPDLQPLEWRERVQFLQSQFGVETMADYGWWFARHDDDADRTKRLFDLASLEDDETIARLAVGIRRFKLPDDHNPLKLLQRLRTESDAGSDDWQYAGQTLAGIYENRRQYPRAAEMWQALADGVRTERQGYLDRRDQIVEPWGRLEPVVTQPAGRGATIDYRFRNGRRVEFTARPIKISELIADLKKYLADNAGQLQWEQMNLDQLGYRLVVNGQEKYLGEAAARWSLDLEPRAAHFDRRITVTTPLQQAGAYLVTGRMEGGNEHRVVVWLADTAIVKKPLADKALYYVADAVTGAPLAQCNVEFFGFWQEHLGPGNRYRVNFKDFAELTDENGMATLPADEANRRHQWLAIATTPAGRLAYLGFSGVWEGAYYDAEYQQVKVFTITDRPVYRPGQEVHFKFWVANAKFDQDDASEFAAKSFLVEIRDPRNEKVYSETIVAGAHGGLAGTWKLPAGATLGQYQLTVVNHGGGSFRVEEYKKPEFEVAIDAPERPVQLGEKFRAKISAKYYFGAPVVEARVKYKVLRTPHDAAWFPPSPWDWLYGPGYWWFQEEYSWYPGWARWGCVRPAPPWFWRPTPPPEVVAELEAPIGADGTVDVEIDTEAAKAFHPDQDHSYRIEAEVTDQSRRTIVASGQVLAARAPFRVYVWGNRGFYRAGDTMELEMAARTLDGRPVRGDGVVRLLKISYDDGKPVETEAAKWNLPTDDAGRASLQIKAADPGQYRVAYALTEKAPPPAAGDAAAEAAPAGAASEGNANERNAEPSPPTSAGDKPDKSPRTVEGALVLTVRGESFDGGDFQFNDLEIVADRRQYAPGEKASLQVNVNRAGATVLLFVRPANGVYLPPRVVRVAGKSTVVEVEIAQRDMPNFFVEAVTVHGGRMHTVVREVFVPPTQRVYDVSVHPSAKEYLPGEHAKVRFKLTDLAGDPVVGSTVVAIYDKALDYIAGDGRAPDIREFFWKWRRSHNPQSETSLGRVEAPVAKPDEKQMADLGVFGASTADEEASVDRFSLGGGFEVRGRALGRAGAMINDAMAAPMAAAAPAESAAKAQSEPGAGGAAVEPVIRQNFADTALWVGALETDANGVGTVELDMPENLTAWRVNVWAMGRGTRVGEGSAEVVTRKNIIVRLQAPRFFVETDEAVLSANVHNYLKTAKEVRVRLELDGGVLDGPSDAERTVTIPAGGEERVDWRVRVTGEGTAVVRMAALTDQESDAVQMSFPALVHGMLKTEARSGAVRPDQERASVKFTVPQRRRPESTRLEVRYSPTLAGAMVDALPYLIDYPYGCTEQTLNRFLPAVLAQRTLQRLGIDLADVQAKRANLNAQEIGDDRERAAQWKRYDANPVFDDDQMRRIVKEGVDRLAEMQLSDGGWGWFSGYGERSTAHTTATVVRGLLIARNNDVAIVPAVLDDGVAWLRRYQAAELAALDNWDREAARPRRKDRTAKSQADNLDALVYLVLTEAERPGGSPPDKATARTHARMRDYLYQDRTRLAVYSLATFGLALQQETAGAAASRPPAEMLPMVLRNLSQFVREDDENQTAWLDLPDNAWWYWYGSEYEAHAYYLKLLAAAEPQSEVAPRLVKYLLNNRKHASTWNSTRDTALVVEAFADYLQATDEAQPNMSLEVLVDGKAAKTVEITPQNLFTFDNRLVIEGAQLAAGDHVVELRKQGRGAVYFNAYLENFTLEDRIERAGLELKIDRRYFQLVPDKATATTAGGRGQAVEHATEKYQRRPLADLAELESGALVEVELAVESKNDYEYVMLEDLKPAGFEPVEVRSGYNGNALGAYVEYRDQRVALFARTLARGTHSVSYRLRAETPGRFSALPARASGMYAPELRANSDEFKVQVHD